MKRPFSSRLKRGALISVLVGGPIFLLSKIVLGFFGIRIHLDFKALIPGGAASDLFITSIGLLGLILLIDFLIEKASIDQPFLNLLSSLIPPIRIALMLKKGGDTFKEVEFLFGKNVKFGILMSPEGIYSKMRSTEVFPVWELRPGSFAGGPMQHLAKGDFEFTGRSGLEAYGDIVWGFGNRDKTKQDKKK